MAGARDHLGEFEQFVLLAVLRLGERADAVRIQEELERRVGREASVSAIYITFTRLESKGMVSSAMGEPTEVRGGKARRLYTIEPAGLAALHKSRGLLMTMWQGVEDRIDQGGELAHGK